MEIIQKNTPNFEKGTNKPFAIVIHVMDGSLIGTDSWFATPISSVSAHYGIGKNGEIHQYVQETDSAWHAGQIVSPSWNLLRHGINPNTYTIGIEHEGGPNDSWTEEMKKSSSSLIKDICSRWNIPVDRDHIIGHYQIKASKPNCPATNKGIIDELIKLASGGIVGANKEVSDAIMKLQEAMDILKGI